MRAREKTAHQTLTDAEFLERWKLWKKALNGREDSSLVVQLESLCWDMGCFEAIRASWQMRTAADGETLLVNPIMFHFVTGCFLQRLCIGIRKLTDCGSLVWKDSTRSDQSVHSLHSVIADIRQNAVSFTRHRLFSACGIEYNADEVRRRHEEYVRVNYPRGGVFALPRELNERESEMLHERWDSYCGCGLTVRSPGDFMRVDFLDQLLSEVRSINSKVAFLVNKYFAHAATLESRNSAKLPSDRISLDELQGLLVRCGRMINSISAILSDAEFEFVPSAVFDKWEHWGCGWDADPDTLEAAWRAWEARMRHIRPMPAEDCASEGK